MKNRLLSLLLIFASLLSLFLVFASAEESTETIPKKVTLSDTTIEEDFANLADVEGNTFDVADYPPIPNADPEFLTIVEDADLPTSYALYIYIYNPGQREFYVTSNPNRLQISFNEGTSYSHGYMTFIDKTEDNLFYKFRLVPKAIIYRSLSLDKREIRVSGFEIAYFDDPTHALHEYASGKKYREGMGKSELGLILTFEGNGSEARMIQAVGTNALSLKVETAHYRTSMPGETDKFHQLMTVYFAVPDEFFDSYGSIRSIRYDMTKYENVPYVLYNSYLLKADDYLLVGDVYSVGSYSFLDYIIRLSRSPNAGIDYSKITAWDWFWYNVFVNPPASRTWTIISSDTSSSTVCSGSSLLPKDKMYLSSHDVQTHFAFFPDHLTTEGKYILKEVSLDNPDDFLSVDSYVKGTNWAQRFADYGFNGLFGWLEDDSYDCDPIAIVEEADYDLSDAEFSAKYLIDETDVFRVKQCRDTANRNGGGKVVLLRFDLTTYVAKDADYAAVQKNNGNWNWKTMKNAAGKDAGLTFSYNTVYQDLDIIDMTWQNDQSRIVIPVVSDPVQFVMAPVVPGQPLEPNPDTPSIFGDKDNDSSFPWLAILFGVGGVLLVIVLVKTLPALSQARVIRSLASDKQAFRKTRRKRRNERQDL